MVLKQYTSTCRHPASHVMHTQTCFPSRLVVWCCASGILQRLVRNEDCVGFALPCPSPTSGNCRWGPGSFWELESSSKNIKGGAQSWLATWQTCAQLQRGKLRGSCCR